MACFPPGARAAEAGVNAVATLAKAKQAPTIDGKMAEGEWDHALMMQPFMGWRRSKGDARMAQAFVTFTDEHLYIAVHSAVPPTGPRATKTFDDGRLISDSGVEIWIDPNSDNREAGKGDLGFYQNIINAVGTVKDQRLDPSPDTGWNGEWETAHHVDKEAMTWTGEFRITWKKLGWEPGTAAGRTLGLLISRNFKSPWNQVVFMPQGASFVNKGDYPVMKLTEDAPTVRIEQIGEHFFDGMVELKVRVVNPGPARKAEVDLFISSSDMPSVQDQKVLDLPAGGSAVYEFSLPKGRLHSFAEHTFNLTVQDVDSGELLLRHKGMSWTEAPERQWNVRTGPNPAAAVKIKYYPSHEDLVLRIDPRELSGEAMESTAGRFTVSGPDGETLLEQGLDWADEDLPFTPSFELTDLAGGEYEVSVQIDGWDDAMVRGFERRYFGWENNNLGKTTRVYAPFEPIRVADDTLSVVMRDYQIGELGLPRQINTVGKDLLVGPVQLVVEGGEALSGEGRFTSTQGHAAVYQGEASHPAVTAKTQITTEYDGCMKVELELAPGQDGAELPGLYLDIPVNDAMAPLYHVSTTALRQNPAGATPEGEGLIWDSRDFPDGEWFSGFRPYIWIGGEERGICWFADNDKGWVVDTNLKKGVYDPALSLHRGDGRLHLRVHLVQKPIKLEGSRKIVFGLMASPAKPMPEDWRRIGRRDSKKLVFSMGHVFGLPTTYSAKYPLGKDFSAFNQIQGQRLSSGFDHRAYLRRWADRHLPADLPTRVHDKFVKLLGHGIRRGRGFADNYVTVYFEEFHSTAVYHEEVPTFYSEWTGGWNRGNYPDLPQNAAFGWRASIGTGALVPSYRDFAVYYAAEWLRRGFGIYFDNSFPKRAYDTKTTAAYEIAPGRIQPSAGMWNHREYLKRIWVLHQQLELPTTPQYMMIHMTNTHIIPYMVWNESNLDLEWMMNAEPAQAKYSHEMLRVESIGRQSGNVPVVIAGTTHGKSTPAQQKIAKRTRWGAMLVHEIKGGITVEHYPEPVDAFGYGLPDCEVTNYWADEKPLSVSDPECKWLLLERGGEAMLVLCTWNPDPAEVVFELDTAELGMTPGGAVDAETGEA